MLLETGKSLNGLDLSSAPKVCVNGVKIEYSLKITDLGVVIDNKLRWEDQVLAINKKAMGTLYRLKQFKGCLPIKLRIYLVKSLIFPLIDYGCTSMTGCSGETDNNLKKITNCCIRFVFDLEIDSHISTYYDKLHWLMPAYRRQLFLGKTMYKILKSGKPEFLADKFALKPLGPYSSRRVGHLDLNIPRSRCNYGLGSFSASGAKFWNSLPVQIRKESSIASFGKALNEFLLSEQARSIYGN